MPSLKYINDETSQFIALQKGTNRIGRSPQSQLEIRSPVVSKVHAIVERYDDRCTLENKSPNGTLVNGRRLHQIAILKHGDKIQVGLTVFEFHQDDGIDSGCAMESGRNMFKFVAGTQSSSEESIRRQAVKPGSSVTRNERHGSAEIGQDKIRGCVSLLEQTLASLATTDSVRKLSQLLRFSASIRQCVLESDIQCVFGSIHQLFPQSTQIVLATDFSADMATFRVLATSCRDGSESALICDDVIHRAATRSECLLVSDQWRDAPTEKPRLSTMRLVSVLCVPMRTACGKCCGVLQLIATAPNPEFDISDLERLAILAQLLTIVLPQP